MKKILYFGVLAALLLGVSACSNELEPELDGTEVQVQFVANLGDVIDSRTISDGTKADVVWFFVYENGAENSALRQAVRVTDKHATITTKLVKGHTYSFVFFAQHNGQTFWGLSLTANGPTITVRPGSSRNPITCNDDNADAFYNVLKDYEVTQSFTENVTLYRPFAQINILASDAASVTDFENYTSSINGWAGDVKFPETMNLLTGETSGSTMATILSGSLPTEPLPGYEQYKLIATRYVLAPVDRMIVSALNFDLAYGQSHKGTTIENVPIQRNYRTNIIGDFFTEPSTFNIEINPMYETPDYNIYPATKLSGVFSVAADKKVHFAAGNLQYHTGTHAWRFASNQYDVIGEDDNIRLGDPTLSAWVDLFAWSCESVPYGVSPSNKDADYTGDFMDWGDLFADDWYTLTKDEMQYLLTGRSNAANLRAEGTVAGQNGLILLPDEWTLPAGLTFVPGYVGLAGWNGVTDDNADVDEYTENIYTAAQWSQMEAAGAVFLPHAGSRTGGYGNTWIGASQTTETNPATGYYSWVDNIQYYGYYWTSTVNPTNSNNAYYLITPTTNATWDAFYQPGIWSRERRRGNSVRLVKPEQTINGGGEGMIDDGDDN